VRDRRCVRSRPWRVREWLKDYGWMRGVYVGGV
jgi:hypothetical protein